MSSAVDAARSTVLWARVLSESMSGVAASAAASTALCAESAAREAALLNTFVVVLAIAFSLVVDDCPPPVCIGWDRRR
jgi:hypothetical protein